MIKRIFCCALVVIMVMSFGIASFAANVTTETSQKAETTVTYGLDSSYLVTIPDAVVINTDTGVGEAAVSVSNVIIPNGTALSLTVHGDSYVDGQWHLTDVANADNQLGYEISAAPAVTTYVARGNSEATVLGDGSEVLRLPAGEAWNATVSSGLEFALLEDVTHSGNYSDTITFTVDIVEDGYNHNNPALHPTGTIPAGATYTRSIDGKVLIEGDTFPALPRIGDIYRYEDYEYRYNQYYNKVYEAYESSWLDDETQNGWGVKCINYVTSEPGPILESISGRAITNLFSAFTAHESMEVAPAIPLGATTLSHTFYQCTNLTQAPEIPANVTDIDNTFRGCTSLQSTPVIPDSITHMYGTFADCSSLTTITNLPNTLKDLDSVFSGCTSLTVAPVLPEGLTSLGYGFSGCTSLTVAPIIPGTVTFMNGAFSGCASIEEMPYIPDGVESMDSAFSGCTSLTTATAIPSSVVSMGATFQNCTALTGIVTINARLAYNHSSCFENVDFDAQNLYLAGTSTMLDTLGATGLNYCDECNGKCLNPPEVPKDPNETGLNPDDGSTPVNGETYLCGDYIYTYTESTKSMRIPAGGTVTTVKGWSVALNPNVVNKSKTTYGVILESINGEPVISLEQTFSGCTAMTVAPVIPSSVTNLTYAFYNCTSLTTAPIVPSSVTNMHGTFSGCTKLTGTITINANVESTYCASSFALVDFNSQRITLAGSSTTLDVFGATGKNYCNGCNGRCYDISHVNLNPDDGSTPVDGETYTYGDYIYSYHSNAKSTRIAIGGPTTVSGWSVALNLAVTDKKQTSYGPILESINGEPIVSLDCTFLDCSNLKVAPNIPSTVIDMDDAFYRCTSLTGTITINATPTSYAACFGQVDFEAQNITLAGSCTILDTLGATGKNYCPTCNGKCKGTH